MNIHAALSKFHRDPNYRQIIAYAVEHGAGMNEAELVALVERQFTPQTYLEPSAKTAPLAVFGAELIDPGAFAQMASVLRLPVAIRGALMPDAHHGYAMPIGGVAVLDRAVSPSFVGYDIGCMMAVSTYPIILDQFETERPALADALRRVTSFGLGASQISEIDHPVMEDPRWGQTEILKRLKPLARQQLGSSGGGNHFADLCELRWNNGRAPEVALMTHSGSRGTGHKLATHYVEMAKRETRAIARGIEAGYEWLPTDTEAGQEYLLGMELMGDYARANHACIHAAFAEAIGLASSWYYWNRHNFAWETDEGWVHRKGATPARAGELGIIPGSSGTLSYIVKGKGNAASIESSSHGAGRPFSRTEAKRRHDAGKVEAHMKARDILTFGLAPDETPFAYKDIGLVMAAQTDLVDIVATLTPRVVIMGGQSDDGD